MVPSPRQAWRSLRLAGILAVVQMNRLQPPEADDAVKFCQHAVQVVDDVVSSVGHVAGVQADAHLAGELHPVQNGPQLLKTAAYFAALACHGLQQNGGGLIGPQDGVESVGNESDAGLASLPHMAAGMEVVILS